MSHKVIHYDPFTVESILMHYWVPAATVADKAAAIQEMIRRGHGEEEIAGWLVMTPRNVARLKLLEVVPLEPIPEWTQREWPRCSKGLHEMSPDNLYSRTDRNTDWKGCVQCRNDAYRNLRWRRMIEQSSNSVSA